MARNSKTLTESMYKAIKILLNGGASVPEAAEYMKVSHTTVYYIRATENYEEYLQHKDELIARRKARNAAVAINVKKKEEEKKEPQVIEHRQSVTLVANHYMAEQLQKQTELLTLISNKLAFIVDELCGTGVKKEG